MDKIYPYTLSFVFLSAVVIFIVLNYFKAPYGRYYRPTWGPAIPSRLAWIVMESPAVIFFGVIYFMGEHAWAAEPLLFFFLWQIHYLYRTVIYPIYLHRSSTNMSLLVVASAFFFNIINGFNIAYYISNFDLDGEIVLGVFLYFLGMAIHIRSDFLLYKIGRKEKGYQVPQTFLFRWVCSPNYLGEIIQWTGFALATWCLPALAFVVFTISNLVPRALQHLEWYRRTFPDYPKERKAIIPFVF